MIENAILETTNRKLGAKARLAVCCVNRRALVVVDPLGGGVLCRCTRLTAVANLHLVAAKIIGCNYLLYLCSPDVDISL